MKYILGIATLVVIIATFAYLKQDSKALYSGTVPPTDYTFHMTTIK